MDKFGILGLLSSILKSKSEDNSNNSDDILTKTNETGQPENISLAKPKADKPVPLQNYMLSTINSHDEFVKRVMLNNKKSDTV